LFCIISIAEKIQNKKVIMLTLGIDIGSITAKGALLKGNKVIVSAVINTGYNSELAGEQIYRKIVEDSGIEEGSIDRIVSTGYGRNSIKRADRTITEITCHAAGAYYHDQKIRSIIDIGGQDSKTIVLDDKGHVLDFAMNDKCAAGTGRFLEVMARALQLDLDEFGELSLNSVEPATISSTCTVFAESEVISFISKGESRENIIAGIHSSVAVRVAAMAARIGVSAPVMMTGGVAKNIGVVRALEKQLNTSIKVSKNAQINGAIGAAVLAGNLE